MDPMMLTLAGFGVGMLFGMIFSGWSNSAYLRGKAESSFKTGIFINGKVYYIVSENDYVHKILLHEDDSVVHLRRPPYVNEDDESEFTDGA